MTEQVNGDNTHRDKVSAEIDEMIRMLKEKYPDSDDTTGANDSDSTPAIRKTEPTENTTQVAAADFSARDYLETFNRELLAEIADMSFAKKTIGGLDPDSVYRGLKDLALNMGKRVRRLAEAYERERLAAMSNEARGERSGYSESVAEDSDADPQRDV